MLGRQHSDHQNMIGIFVEAVRNDTTSPATGEERGKGRGSEDVVKDNRPDGLWVEGFVQLSHRIV